MLQQQQPIRDEHMTEIIKGDLARRKLDYISDDAKLWLLK